MDVGKNLASYNYSTITIILPAAYKNGYVMIFAVSIQSAAITKNRVFNILPPRYKKNTYSIR